jgi:hypothetical protein
LARNRLDRVTDRYGRTDLTAITAMTMSGALRRLKAAIRARIIFRTTRKSPLIHPRPVLDVWTDVTRRLTAAPPTQSRGASRLAVRLSCVVAGVLVRLIGGRRAVVVSRLAASSGRRQVLSLGSHLGTVVVACNRRHLFTLAVARVGEVISEAKTHYPFKVPSSCRDGLPETVGTRSERR